MNVTVFGTGYVGLVQGAVLADVGHNVVCVDVDAEKVARLEQGIIPIYEPGLEALVKENYAAGRLTFTTQAEKGVKHGEVQFIAVGTPPRRGWQCRFAIRVEGGRNHRNAYRNTGGHRQ